MKLELPPVLKLDFRFESPRIITNLQTLFWKFSALPNILREGIRFSTYTSN
jgi:hypothetical protein